MQLPENLGRHIFDGLELPVEVRNIIEPAPETDLCYTPVCLDQHFTGMAYPDLI